MVRGVNVGMRPAPCLAVRCAGGRCERVGYWSCHFTLRVDYNCVSLDGAVSEVERWDASVKYPAQGPTSTNSR
jgi:hypothetical protein